MAIRTLIADDEELARERVRQLLAAHDDIEVIGECVSGAECVAAIAEQRPDLVFLDIQMPRLDGFGVIDSLSEETLPVVIFITAHDEYAVRAFETQAVDYLLKPLERERFEQALRHARERLAANRWLSRDALLAALADSRGAERPRDRLAIRTEGKIIFVRTADIRWIESAGNYVKLHLQAATYQMRATMAAAEGWLDSERFIRIHRTAIVNLDAIREIQPWFHGEYVIILDDGTRLKLSKTYRQRLDGLLGSA